MYEIKLSIVMLAVVCQSLSPIVSWSASLFGDAFDGRSAGLFRVAANKPDWLTRVGRSLGSPYLSHTALQAPTPRLVYLIGVVSPSLWRPYKLLIVVLMPPPNLLLTQSSPNSRPPLGDRYRGCAAHCSFLLLLLFSSNATT